MFVCGCVCGGCREVNIGSPAMHSFMDFTTILSRQFYRIYWVHLDMFFLDSQQVYRFGLKESGRNKKRWGYGGRQNRKKLELVKKSRNFFKFLILKGSVTKPSLTSVFFQPQFCLTKLFFIFFLEIIWILKTDLGNAVNDSMYVI